MRMREAVPDQESISALVIDVCCVQGIRAPYIQITIYNAISANLLHLSVAMQERQVSY